MESGTPVSIALKSNPHGYHIHVLPDNDKAQPPKYCILSKWVVVKEQYEDYLITERPSFTECEQWIDRKMKVAQNHLLFG